MISYIWIFFTCICVIVACAGFSLFRNSAKRLTFSASISIMKEDAGKRRLRRLEMDSQDIIGMRAALAEAQKAREEGEVPVGAALFLGGRLLGGSQPQGAVE